MLSRFRRAGWLSQRGFYRVGLRALQHHVRNSSGFFSTLSRDDDNGSPEEGADSASALGQSGADEDIFDSDVLYDMPSAGSSPFASEISGYSDKSSASSFSDGLEVFPDLEKKSLINEDLDDLPLDFIDQNTSAIDLASDISLPGSVGDLEDDYDVTDDGLENLKRKILAEGLVDFQQLANAYKTASPQKPLRNLKKEREKHVGRTKYHLEDVFESTSSIHSLLSDFKHETHYNTLGVEADDAIFACLLRSLGRRKGYSPKHVSNMYKVFLERIYDDSLPFNVGIQTHEALIEIFVGVGLMDNAFDVFENMVRHCDAEEYQFMFSRMTKWLNRNHSYLKNNDKHFLRLAHIHLRHPIRMNAVAMYNVLSALLRMNELDVAESLIQDYYEKYQTSKVPPGLITWIDQDQYGCPDVEGDRTKMPLSGLNESMEVLRALARIGRSDLMESMGANIASEVQKRGRYLDLAVVAQILDIFGAVGKFDEAYAWFGKGTRSDKFTESVAFDKRKMLAKKTSGAGTKKKRVPPPKLTAYSRLHDPHGCVAMIDVFDKFGKLDLALDLYHELVEEAKLSRSVLPQYIVNCVIAACGNGGAWEIACHIYNDVLHAPNVRFVGKEIYSHMALMHVLMNAHVDDDEMKVILEEQMNEVKLGIKRASAKLVESEKTRKQHDKDTRMGRKGSKRLQAHRGLKFWRAYNVPLEFKDNDLILKLQKRLFLELFARGNKKLILRDPRFFESETFPKIEVSRLVVDQIDDDEGDDTSETFETALKGLMSSVSDENMEETCPSYVDGVDYEEANHTPLINDLEQLIASQATAVEGLSSADAIHGKGDFCNVSELLDAMGVQYRTSLSGNSYMIDRTCRDFNLWDIFKPKIPISSFLLEDVELPSKGQMKYNYLKSKRFDKRKELFFRYSYSGIGLLDYSMFKFDPIDHLVN